MYEDYAIRSAQKSQLFTYLKLRRDNAEKGITVYGLDELIAHLEAGMEAEDVAWVEKKIATTGGGK